MLCGRGGSGIAGGGEGRVAIEVVRRFDVSELERSWMSSTKVDVEYVCCLFG